ncbi:ankyrin repeat-containing domain protein, partial [Amylostereum chailletii]
MTPRLVGGRSSLHLAAQMGNVALVKKMLARNEENKIKAAEAAKAKAEAEAMSVDAEPERPSSEDDWESERSDEDEDEDEDVDEDDKDYVKPKVPTASPKGQQTDADVLEDNSEEPDILDIAVPDWDFAFTPLGYAILSGSLELVDVLLAAGADPKLPTKAKQGKPLHPLTMTLFTPDEARGAEIVAKLVAAGASSSMADDNQFTIFHRVVSAGKPSLVAALLNHDPNAKTSLDVPAWTNYYQTLLYPLVTAVSKKDYAMLALLLAYGAKVEYTAEDVSRADDSRPKQRYYAANASYLQRLCLPVEVAIANVDDVVYTLIELGAMFD